MPLPGVVRFPPDAAARYRAAGYWDDRLLIEHWEEAFTAHPDRLAVVDDTASWTYAELADRSHRLARVLLDLGLRPLDRVVVQLPNTTVFAALYVALQRIGAIPIMALPSHRYREIEQFVRLSGAVALASPTTGRDVDFTDVFTRVAQQRPTLRHHLTLGGGELALEELMQRAPVSTDAELLELRGGLDPEDPCVFQLSGGTHGHPQADPAQPQRLRLQLPPRRLGVRRARG